MDGMKKRFPLFFAKMQENTQKGRAQNESFFDT